jgi:DNA replication protein DnaC
MNNDDIDNFEPVKVFVPFRTEEIKDETCELHGPFKSRNLFREHWSTCPFCSEIKWAEENVVKAANEAAEKVRNWEKRIGQAGIPERFTNRTLESYNATNDGQRKALAFAKEYADNFKDVLCTGRSAIFCGKPGTGKTHLSIGIALEVMKLKYENGYYNYNALFLTVQRMVRRMKESWRKDSEESESDVMSILVEPELLIIDEIGVQFGSDFEKNFMFDVLNSRYENHRPTLLLSNLSVSEVKAFLGERIYDRLREDGGQCVSFDWTSHRGK